MTISLIIHTENKDKLSNLLDLIDKHPDRKSFVLNLHAKGYIPWSNDELKNRIISFKSYYAFPTEKNVVESVVELISKVQDDRVILIDENCISLPINLWELTNNSLFFRKKDLKHLNLDTKYKSVKWLINDLFSQKQKLKVDLIDESDDYLRYSKKIESPLFHEKIIYIDGGMGDHIMALPLIEKLSSQVYVCCKYPFIYNHIPLKGIVDWNDELFGGYKIFVYEYGSKNNSKTIIDAFFGMYDFERTDDDILIYKGKREGNVDVPSDRKLALICTSAAKINNIDSNKDWKDIRWFKLVNELKLKGYYVIQVGSIKDNQIPNVDLKFLDKPLSNLSKLIDDSSLWISVDTFFHHFASAIKPEIGICLTPFYNDHAKHPKVKYIEKDCGKSFYDRRWWLDLQQPERKECMDLITVEDVIRNIKSKKKIITYSLTIDDNCSNWRIFQQYVGLDYFDIVFKHNFGSNINEDLSADIIIIQRPILYCLEYVKLLRKNGIKVILDYDDPLPFIYPGHPKFKDSITEVINLFENCDLITTSTERMKNYLELFTQVKCVVLPNVINPRYINERKTKNRDKIVLGWFGSSGHIDCVYPIKNVLLKILNEFENVFLNLYTDNHNIYEILKHEKTTHYKYNTDFIEFQNTVGDIDINIAPINDSHVFLLKSNIRVILPGYKGIPSVVSNFAEYKDFGGENVLICETEEDWYENIKKLIIDKEIYDKYSNNIKNKVNSDFIFEKWIESKVNILNNLITI